MVGLALVQGPGRPCGRPRRHRAGLDGERWRDRFGLPFDSSATGYAHDADEVASVSVDAALLADYHAEVHRHCLTYVDTITAAELQRVVDDAWDPPVTASVRLVSVLGDCLQHVGQAAYLLPVAQRAVSPGR